MTTRKLASDPTGPIGRKIRDHRQNLMNQIADLREEIEDNKALLDILDEAWGKWDTERLVDFGIISPTEAKILDDYFASEH